MLVATREPLPYPGADGGVPAHHIARAGGPTHRLARLMTVLQVAGSLLAIPVGIASGYSVYRANFSPEATCQSLRSNILATLDKGVDASTRRMLVRRDVEAFEKSCGTVDPDAYAAFKTLLAAQPPAATVTATTPPQKQAEPHPALATRQPAAESASVAASSDAVWVAAVRRALVTEQHEAEPRAGAATADIAAPPPAVPSPLDIRATIDEPAHAPMPAANAPALPPATSVTAIPSAAENLDHPVPPASIPEAVAAPAEPAARAHGGLRLGAWIARIPLVGPMINGHSR